MAVGTTPVVAAAAVRSGLRLCRRAVTTAAAAVGMAAVMVAGVTMVGDFWINSWLP